MIIKNGTDSNIERHKNRLGIKGDVYFVNNRIASLESHKRLFPYSNSITIQEAEAEYIAFMESEKERLRLLAEAEEEAEENQEE